MNIDLESIKRRFGIIGTHPALQRAIEVAYQVAPTDLAVLVQGESGVGKEFFPQIIHAYGRRKHGKYVAVNCGAIPEGTIDSELFGHVKGSFTGALDNRAGYFEVADGGSIFLDEVAELPLATQARLLRVLENGEFIKVGSSTAQKTDIRIIAATNVNLSEAIAQGRFREDLYYRLSAIPIIVPPLRERGKDILLLFRYFAGEFAEKYHMPPIRLDNEAEQTLLEYHWPGNVRQLKNVTEQVSIMESERMVTKKRLELYLHGPDQPTRLPALYQGTPTAQKSERELLYGVLFDMRQNINELKELVTALMARSHVRPDDELVRKHAHLLKTMDSSPIETPIVQPASLKVSTPPPQEVSAYVDSTEVEEEPKSLANIEEDTIRQTLTKNGGLRRKTARELGISERTLYRKIREYNIK